MDKYVQYTRKSIMKRAIARVTAAIVVIVIVVIAAVGVVVFMQSGTNTTTSTVSTTISSSSTSMMTTTTSTSSQLINLEYGYSGFIPGGYTPQMLEAAIVLGTWKDLGLNVSLVQFPSGEGSILSAMASGSLDVGDAGPLSLAPALAGGATVKLFGAEMVDSGYAVMVLSNSNVTSLAQVNGTKFSIGMTSVGSGTWVNANLMATAEGLTQGNDYTLVALGSPNAEFAALKQGTVQSIVFPVASALAFANRLGISIRFIANSTSLLPKPWIDLGFVAPTSFIQQHQSELHLFLQGYLNAYNYYKSNETWAQGFIQNYFNVSSSIASQIYTITVGGFAGNTTVTAPALQNALTLAENAGIITNTTNIPPVSSWYVNVK